MTSFVAKLVLLKFTPRLVQLWEFYVMLVDRKTELSRTVVRVLENLVPVGCDTSVCKWKANFKLTCGFSGEKSIGIRSKCMNMFAALSPWDTIGSQGARNFMLCKKPQPGKMADDGKTISAMARKGSGGSWKAWINKSLNLKIYSH